VGDSWLADQIAKRAKQVIIAAAMAFVYLEN
jgi:hypothetical protein